MAFKGLESLTSAKEAASPISVDLDAEDKVDVATVLHFPLFGQLRFHLREAIELLGGDQDVVHIHKYYGRRILVYSPSRWLFV